MTLVLLNLVDNAVKHAGDGGEISVRLRRVPGAVALSIADKGAGIAADEQRRIFERFYRAERTRARNVRGSGIGLALVKYIAEAHGGRVQVDSVPGQGATFTVFVPVAPLVTPAPEQRGAA
jgi:signal transduction histidine kinase